MTESRRVIPNAVPHLAGNEWTYLKECLDTNWVSSVGPFVDRFEREVAAYVGVPHAVATVNGTAALHVALLAAGVRPDDEVLVPTFTFIATANAVTYCGAHPLFLDSETVSWGLDAGKLGDFLSRECVVKDGQLVNRATGRIVRAVVPVHLYGHPVDLDSVLEVARRHPLAVVEDAADPSAAVRSKSNMSARNSLRRTPLPCRKMKESSSYIGNGLVSSWNLSLISQLTMGCCKGKRIAPNSPYMFPANPRYVRMRPPSRF